MHRRFLRNDMKSMLLREITSLTQNQTPLSFEEIAEPELSPGEILLRVTRCGVCRTELDEIEGRTPPPHLPVVLGHQVVGIVEESSNDFSRLTAGQRIGVAWIASACGKCKYCYQATKIYARNSRRRDATWTAVTRST